MHNIPQLFDEQERVLMQDSIGVLLTHSKKDVARIQRSLLQIEQINKILLQTPSLNATETLGHSVRTPETLVHHLIHSDGLIGELDLPFKAVLQRTYLLAKIQLFRTSLLALSEISTIAPEVPLLKQKMCDELAQSIYTQMAENLLLALLQRPNIPDHTKRRAARKLILIWNDARLEIDDFCPLLESAWKARNRVHSRLGCLIGTTEYFSLVAENCSDDFLNFFARDGVSKAENQAFAEFLFGLTWEELETLRFEMKKQEIPVAEEKWVSKVLGREIEHSCDNYNNIDPIALYRSYTRRQLAADYRVRSFHTGPHRTAESYLMIYLLDGESDLATIVP